MEQRNKSIETQIDGFWMPVAVEFHNKEENLKINFMKCCIAIIALLCGHSHVFDFGTMLIVTMYTGNANMTTTGMKIGAQACSIGNNAPNG